MKKQNIILVLIQLLFLNNYFSQCVNKPNSVTFELFKGISTMNPTFAGGMGKIWALGKFALKKMTFANIEQKDLGLNEVKAMSEFTDYYDLASIIPNKCYLEEPEIREGSNITINKGSMYYLMELYKLGSLYGILKQIPTTDNLYIFDLLYKLVIAIKNLHSLDYKHLDLKPENIFMMNEYVPVIGDFGMSLKGNAQHKTVCGTNGYISREILSSKYYSKYADIYALGIIFREILMRKSFNTKLPIPPIEEIPENPMFNIFIPLIKRMTRSCNLTKDPDTVDMYRININQVEEHLIWLLIPVLKTYPNEKDGIINNITNYLNGTGNQEQINHFKSILERYFEKEYNYYNTSTNPTFINAKENTNLLLKFAEKKSAYYLRLSEYEIEISQNKLLI